MNRRTFLKSAALAGAAAMGAPAVVSAQTRPSRPNIVFLLADQWRASATGYAGDPNVKTPNLDRLAAESVRFRTAVSTCPVCTPYRAALMTGQFPTTTGMFVNDLHLPDSALCMAELYREAGYDTGYIGKWHLDGHERYSYVAPERRQGFEYWKGAECDHEYFHSHYYAGDSPGKRYWEGYDAFAQTRDAQAYLQGRVGHVAPFLLMVSYGVPHFPHETSPQEYRDLYPPESIQLPPNVPESMREKARQEACGYYAHCAALDKCVGDIVQTLQETGLADNSILVFTSDHGEMMGSHGDPPFRKQQPWDESILVPFLLRYPALHAEHGHEIRTPINTPDILPTLLGLSGLPIPGTVQGEDLSTLVRGETDERDRAALIMAVAPFADHFGGKEYRGVRTRQYTYARSLEGPWLLFDNDRDPWQMDNLANRPEHAALQSDLDGRLQAELARIGDSLRPAREFLDEWGYEVDAAGCIPCVGDIKVQGPAMARAKE